MYRMEQGYPMRAEAYTQPGIYVERTYEHKVSPRYTILSERKQETVELALENLPITELIWNGMTQVHEMRTRI